MSDSVPSVSNPFGGTALLRLVLFVLCGLMGETHATLAAESSEDYSGALAGAPCPSSIDATLPLSLARAVDLALCHNAQIRDSWAVIREQAASLGEAKAAYWPTLSATATELNDRTGYPGSSAPASTRTGDTLYSVFDWRLFDFGGRDANRRSAQAQLEVAVASRDATVQKILASVVQAYFEAITAWGLLNDKREDEAVARETLASTQRRASTGQSGQNDVLQGATALAKSTLDLNRSQAAYEKAMASLNYLLGLPADSAVRLPQNVEDTGATEEEDLKAWISETERHHPAISAARAALEAAREQVTSTRATGRPTLDLTADFYQNGFPNQGLNNFNSRVVTFGLSITVPLFDGWATHYKVEQAKALVKAKEAELEDTVQSTLMSVVGAHADAQSALRNLRASEDLLNTAQQAFASSQRRYVNGAANIVELLSTQSARADAEEERTRCLAEWQAARLTLLASAGRLDRAAVQR